MQPDGAVIWNVKTDSPLRASPTVIDDKVLVQTTDNQIIAIDAANGQRIWTHLGIVESIALLGSASPAANKNITVATYSSGEIFSLKLSNGAEFWKDSLSNLDQRESALPMNDITASPLISEQSAYVVSYAGRMAALDLISGTRIWERPIKGQQTPWLVGQYLFLITENNKLICLDKKDGKAIWITQLPRWQEDDRDKPILWHGPVVANNSVIIVSSYGTIRKYRIANGTLKEEQQIIYEPIFLPPVIAEGTLFILSGDGTITAID